MQERFLTVKEVAGLLGVNASTIYRAVRQEGGLRGYKIQGAVRFRPADIEAYLAAREIKPPEKKEAPFANMTRFKYTLGMKVV